ncbi:metallo-beta-lactamase superfamily protein [Massariosphaeria phaeospora]|uniref:Metallo-beta-lactamase superfamily protein n=1 Tax=Massariosphaeria phaeospora TaxID=100035 RepID=A0A7C8I4A0_9PLEO|nr:metallo-beta-lactamase superfamily protein [Massariosphaeria phaeospora]
MLLPLDSLEILTVVDNEVDPISPAPSCVSASGRLGDVGFTKGKDVAGERGGGEGVVKEISMEQLCCGAHGLSLVITGTRNNKARTLLFDTGPTESIWSANASRLTPPLRYISHIHLSHWHRDHSGGILAALRAITSAKSSVSYSKTTVDLHPSRPTYRGVSTSMGVLSLEADPTFQEIEDAGGKVEKLDAAHEILESYFLVSGEIPRVTEYEHGIKGGVRFEEGSGDGEGKWMTDELILDERFVVCHVKDKGLVLFTGCSHAGVVNVAKHALTLTSDSVPLYAIVGGYHLADALASQISATVRDLKELGVKVLLAGHCTGWRAKFEIEKEMPGVLVPSFVGIKTVI